MTSSTDNQTNTRTPIMIVPASSTLEGGGFEVYRPFPGQVADWFDPFLLLDEMAPNHHSPGEAVGAPAHPHRGFETVTYIFRGEVEHHDSAGNHGLIGPGDARCMTAGAAIIHSEMPSARIQTNGGVSHGIQLWINLPAALRRTTPKYQALTADQMSSVSGPGWTAEIVAGSLLDHVGPAHTHTPVGLGRVEIQPGSSLRIPATDGHTALVYAFAGHATVGAPGEPLPPHHLAVLGHGGGDIALTVSADAAEPFHCLVLIGEPINEPMVRYGPFVMNTKAEIQEAISDFNAGRMGTIAAIGAA